MKKFVSVQFPSSPFKSYQFVTDIETLQQGDQVVVDTVNGLTIAEVEDYSEEKFEMINSSGKKVDHRWIIQKIDLTAHQERLEKKRRMNYLKKKMENRRKQLEEIQLMALLAKEDENMREMYEEFMELSK